MKHLTVKPYIAGDILSIDAQAAQLCDLAPADYLRWQTHSPDGFAWSFYNDAGEIIACGGLRPVRGHDVMEAWALVGNVGKSQWGRLIAMAKAAIDAVPARRLQAQAYLDHPGAEKTLQHFGFEFEGVMKAYGPDGRDAALYARVKS